MASGYENIWGPKWSQSDDINLKDKKRGESISKYNLYHPSVKQEVDNLFTANSKVQNAFK